MTMITDIGGSYKHRIELVIRTLKTTVTNIDPESAMVSAASVCTFESLNHWVSGLYTHTHYITLHSAL